MTVAKMVFNFTAKSPYNENEGNNFGVTSLWKVYVQRYCTMWSSVLIWLLQWI